MILSQRAGILAAIVSAVAMLTLSAPARSQEVSETHLKAARAAILALGTTDQYDLVLPAAADALKKELIQRDPNLQELILSTVDEKTLALAARRADLEKEAALAYARAFTEAELDAMAEFFAAPAGRKLMAQGPLVSAEVRKAADIWQRGVARDLAQNVGEVLQANAPRRRPAAETPQPAQ